MLPTLSALIALQGLDTAAEAARRRLAEMPSAEQAAAAAVARAVAGLDGAKAKLAENQQARRDLDKAVALVETRLSRFDEHKAAVKTNQEYTALLHEIATAKAEKDGVEEKILELLEAADALSVEVNAAENALSVAKKDAAGVRALLDEERASLNAELARLATERDRQAAGVERPILAKYEQILKQRRMVAVARLTGELCTACHVRLRPAMAQAVRRNTEIVQCDSCQRILYFVPPDPTVAPPANG